MGKTLKILPLVGYFRRAALVFYWGIIGEKLFTESLLVDKELMKLSINTRYWFKIGE